MKVVNKNGYEIDYAAALMFMDDVILEKVYDQLSEAWCTEQEIFTAYEEEYEKATGEEWFLSSSNPVW